MSEVRLRQAVLVARDRDSVAAQLQAELGLDEPFEDPGVGLFGLHNAVFALGDQFVEVVSPVQEGTTAGRYLERRGGDGGYMAIFQLADLDAARGRVADAGIRVVWQIELDDIAAMHLHPGDMGGAIVSLDEPDPPQSWRWGGPEWTGRAGTGAPGGLRGITVSVPEPVEVAARWGAVLGAAPESCGVRFVSGEAGLCEIAVAVPEDVRRGREDAEIGGVRFVFGG